MLLRETRSPSLQAGYSGVTGWMCGLQILDELKELGGETKILGQNSWNFVGGTREIWGGLDLLVTNQIHVSNPIKHHQTNKSHKNLGGPFSWGFSKLEQNKTKLG